MSGEEKRGPNLGARTVTRHAAQAGTASVGLMGILQAMVEMQWLDQSQAFLALGLVPPILTSVWKSWDGLRMKDRLNAALDKRLPPSLFLIVVLLCSGCAVQLGTMKPEKFVALDGTMLLACETRGILFTVGDADLCSNSARGGMVSKTFSDMTLGVVRTAGAIIAGFFGGAGAGVTQALQVDDREALREEAEASSISPGATVVPDADVSYEFKDGDPLVNPFTAPGE